MENDRMPVVGFVYISEGYLRRNPYKWVHIVKDKVSHGLHKYLTKDELHAIETARMGTESLDRVRDLFVFQACTILCALTSRRGTTSGRTRTISARSSAFTV